MTGTTLPDKLRDFTYTATRFAVPACSAVPKFMLNHRHLPGECRVAFAAWKGFDSPLRHAAVTATCATGDGNRGEHRIWWTVEATDGKAALGLLPPYVAERTEVNRIQQVPIP
ncbi:MAG TPA: hypothetical protein VEK39_00760 [Solirubrobacterales bacterium]|nr:hypothetical protein [Solirubrobacterales bacterium]